MNRPNSKHRLTLRRHAIQYKAPQKHNKRKVYCSLSDTLPQHAICLLLAGFMRRPQQRRDGQTVSEVGRLAVLANSPKGRQLAARPPQAQCRTKRHILPLLPHTTNYNRITTELQHTKKRARFACISQQPIQRRWGVVCTWHATCDNSRQLEHHRHQKSVQMTNQLQTRRIKRAKK